MDCVQGSDVAKTQQALKDEGFALEVNGNIDTPTVNATKMVQEEKGLKVDGQINPGGPTEKALFGDGGLKSLTPDITQKHPGTVSTAQQVANLERQAKAADDAQKQAQRAEQQRQRKADAQRKSRQAFRTIDEQITRAYRASQQQKQQQEKAKSDEALRKARQNFREIDQKVKVEVRKTALRHKIANQALEVQAAQRDRARKQEQLEKVNAEARQLARTLDGSMVEGGAKTTAGVLGGALTGGPAGAIREGGLEALHSLNSLYDAKSQYDQKMEEAANLKRSVEWFEKYVDKQSEILRGYYDELEQLE